jgi:hypothetical protein
MKEKMLRTLLARLGALLVVVAPAVLGCNHFPLIPNREPAPKPDTPARTPDAASLVEYLNDNASRAQAVQCSRVAVDCKQGRQAIGLDGVLVFQKPKDFRLRLSLVNQPQVDIGSNSNEFWYWIGKANPPYVFHCSYDALSSGRVALTFPFQPEMIVAAMGIGEYDPKAKYEVRDNPKNNYIELVEQATSAQGQPVQRVTVFARNRVAAPNPQVLAHVLLDSKGKMICQAKVKEVQIHRATGAILPQKVTLEWPSQELTMTMTLPDLQVVTISPERAAKVFQRGDLTRYESFDLASRSLDGPGIRRAGTLPPTR